MEDAPDQVNCYKNCDICVLRNGKAKKNDPPIPKELAPISSKPRPAKKFVEFSDDEPMPDVIITGRDMPPVKSEPAWDDMDLPAPAFLADILDTQEEKADVPSKSSRNRRRRKKPSGQHADAAPKQETAEKSEKKQEKSQKPKADKPKQENRPKQEGKPKSDKPRQDKPQKPKQPKADSKPEGKQDAAPKAEGEARPKSNNHHRRRRHTKGPKPEGGAPKAE